MMDKDFIIHAAAILLGVFIAAVAQVLLKQEAMKPHDTLISQYLNFRVIFGYALMVLSTLCSVYAYKVVPLSFGPVLESTSCIYITVFGATIFHEKITKQKILAILTIVAGILVSAIFG